jgi:hypothetical protein
MKRKLDIAVPPSSEARIAQGLCPIHGVKLDAVGRGAGSLAIFTCPVRGCKIEASSNTLAGPYELLKSSQDINLTPNRSSRVNTSRSK